MTESNLLAGNYYIYQNITYEIVSLVLLFSADTLIFFYVILWIYFLSETCDTHQVRSQWLLGLPFGISLLKRMTIPTKQHATVVVLTILAKTELLHPSSIIWRANIRRFINNSWRLQVNDLLPPQLVVNQKQSKPNWNTFRINLNL